MPHRDVVSCSIAGRINNNNSPRGHSPNRERDSYRYDFIIHFNSNFMILIFDCL